MLLLPLLWNMRPLITSRIMIPSGYKFKLSAYDVVGLDFDNTLVQYNLSNLFQLHYSYLANFMIAKKGYHGLSTEMNQNDIDFIRRGLFMDFERGNVLDLSSEGIIISASHGTKKLDLEEIARIYGQSMRWSATDLFVKDKLALWEGPASEQTRSFLDYSDVTGTLIFAKVIDLLDKNEDKYDNVWPNLLEAIIDMYKQDSDFTKELLCNMPRYIHKCEQKVIDFLKNLRQRRKVLLITGSSQISVKKMAECALGCTWESLFDSIIYSAKKPTFFTGNASFMNDHNQPVKLNTCKGHYLRGNWEELYDTIKQELGRAGNCVYLGDSVIQDVYAPSVARKPVDSVSVMDEVLADGHFEGNHLHKSYVSSQFWGPYFGKNNVTTIMGDIVIKVSKLCIPSVSYLANKPLDYEHTPFWQMPT